MAGEEQKYFFTVIRIFVVLPVMDCMAKARREDLQHDSASADGL